MTRVKHDPTIFEEVQGCTTTRKPRVRNVILLRARGPHYLRFAMNSRFTASQSSVSTMLAIDLFCCLASFTILARSSESILMFSVSFAIVGLSYLCYIVIIITQRIYKFRLSPTAQQKRQLAIEFGHARFVWNWALETRSKAYEERKERLNYIGLSRKLTEVKKTEYPWLSEATSGCHTQKLIDLDKAFKNFFDKRAKYPRFKKRHQSQSVRYQLAQRHVEKNFNAESKRLKLPKLGQLKLKWSRLIEGTAKRVTVSKDPCGRYFVSMACEVDILPLPVRRNTIGVDVGIKDIAITSDGFKSGAPKYTYRYARQLRMAQRRLSSKRKGSHRRRKQQYRVARIYARIADSRRDFLHQISSRLINENQVICLEDLNIKGMLRNRCLSKAVADSGLFELRRQLEYKAKWTGRDIFIVDRWAPTSKTCSECGSYQREMPLKIREWVCPDCGEIHDRDINAAKNVLMLGTAGSAGTDKARGAVKPSRAVA